MRTVQANGHGAGRRAAWGSVLLACLTLVSQGLTSPAHADPNWPNEPAGSVLLSDFAFNALSGDGWQHQNPNSSIVSDPTAPLSPNNAMRVVFPQGMPAGVEPEVFYHSLGGSQTEAYMGFWWKASPNFEQEPNSHTTKLAFFLSNGNFDLYWAMNGEPGGPYHLDAQLQSSGGSQVCNGHVAGSWGDACGSRVFPPNQGNVPVVPGNWYKVEMYSKFSTSATGRNGVIRVAVNDVVVSNYTNVNYHPSFPWVQAQIAPTWGGLNSTKTKTDYFWFDHVRLSLP